MLKLTLNLQYSTQTKNCINIFFKLPKIYNVLQITKIPFIKNKHMATPFAQMITSMM
jgi:hypothetical protein